MLSLQKKMYMFLILYPNTKTFFVVFGVTLVRDMGIDLKKTCKTDLFYFLKLCYLSILQLYLQVFQATPNTNCSNYILLPLLKEFPNGKLTLCNDLFYMLF